MKIKIALNLLLLKYASCFLNDEQYESSNAESNIKGMAKLPCNKIYFSNSGYNARRPTLIMWFKYGIASPIYSVDFRHIKDGSHWSADEVLGSRAYFNIDEAVLSIEQVKQTDAGLYKCRIDFEKYPTKNYIVNLSIVVPPEEITISNASGENVSTTTLNPVLEGQSLQLICTAHGGKPAPRVLWWQNEILIDNRSEIILNNQVKNILHLDHMHRTHHGSILKCEAVNGGNKNSISKVVVVNLYLRPLAVRLYSDNKIFSVGNEYKIICETYGSRPPANVSWWLKGIKVNSSFMNTVINSDKNVTTSVLKYQPKSDHHRSKLTCKITNNIIAGSTLTESWNLHVQYAPVVKIKLGTNLDKFAIKENADVYFDCLIDANPIAKKIYWTHNGGILVGSSSRTIISNQTLVLQSIARQSAGNYCCVASNVEGETQSEPFYLDVKYEPICSVNQQLVYGAIRNEKIEVVCNVNSNPSELSFSWKFNNSLIQTREIHSFINGKTYSIATYQPKNELDYGTLLCWAKNELGQQLTPCVFHIIPAGKPDTPHNCSASSNITERSMYISCESGFDGGLPQEFICEVLTNGSSQLKWNITNRKVPEFTINGLETDLDYTIVIYSSNGKGRSQNRIELQVNPSSETLKRHSRIIGMKNSIFFSMWTIILCTVLILLLCLLLILIVSIIRIRKRHIKQKKQKKTQSEVEIVTPVQSDDDRNPDIIPQIEEIHISNSRRPSSSSHSLIQQCSNEFMTYNTFPKSLHFLKYTTVPVETSLPHCDSVIRWIEPKCPSRTNSHVLINTVPPNKGEKNSLISNTYAQTSTLPHKESAV